MHIRPQIRNTLLAGIACTLGLSLALLAYCLAVDSMSVHFAVLAILTTSGPLIARVFEGLVRRRQRLAGLDLGCLAADDEVLVARTVPLALPVIGAFWAYLIVL